MLSPSNSAFPCQLSFHQCSTFICNHGLVQPANFGLQHQFYTSESRRLFDNDMKT
jgi:hypothetical protein